MARQWRIEFSERFNVKVLQNLSKPSGPAPRSKIYISSNVKVKFEKLYVEIYFNELLKIQN